VLAELSKQRLLAEYAQRWSPKRLSALDRTEIYLGFLLTKNVNRLRHRTWRQKVRSASNDGVRVGANVRSSGAALRFR
jgi:hypothetical protein